MLLQHHKTVYAHSSLVLIYPNLDKYAADYSCFEFMAEI